MASSSTRSGRRRCGRGSGSRTATRSTRSTASKLTSADKALEVYTKVREATALQIDIIRRGKPLSLFIRIEVTALRVAACKPACMRLRPAGAPLAPSTIERRAVGPDDVLIDIKFAGICHSDIHQARAEWGPARFPMVPGHEIVGRVSADRRWRT